MLCHIDHEKKAIQDKSVFTGLAVDDPDKFSELFMGPDYKLLTLNDGAAKAYVIFEEHKGGFIFHLVNFTALRTSHMTEDFIKGRVLPYCKVRSLTYIEAAVERRGMARKLEKLGFKYKGDHIYRKEVPRVL